MSNRINRIIRFSKLLLNAVQVIFGKNSKDHNLTEPEHVALILRGSHKEDAY